MLYDIIYPVILPIWKIRQTPNTFQHQIPAKFHKEGQLCSTTER